MAPLRQSSKRPKGPELLWSSARSEPQASGAGNHDPIHRNVLGPGTHHSLIATSSGYAPKDSPQPQVVLALGLTILKPLSWSVSTKSRIVPTR